MIENICNNFCDTFEIRLFVILILSLLLTFVNDIDIFKQKGVFLIIIVITILLFMNNITKDIGIMLFMISLCILIYVCNIKKN